MAGQVTNADVARVLEDRKVRDYLRVFPRRYRHQLDPDECESTANYALLKALLGWDERLANGQRFSTHLYRVLQWEFDRVVVKEDQYRLARRPLGRQTPLPADRRAEQTAADPAGTGDYIRRYLSAEQAEVLRRYRVEDRTAAEIGGELGWSEGRVLRTVHAAEALLRSVID